ncbi:MAG: c-type cytochrome [Ignavibacteria bacterium]|nr:c-type cytochrome [Ignavibacteria bacterium]
MRNFRLVTFYLLMSHLSYLNAQTSSGSDTYNYIAGGLVFLLVLLMFILLFVFSSSKYIYDYSVKQKRSSLIRKILFILNRGVPVEREEDIMFSHAFDTNIRELDNKIPPWFNMLFYGTIIWAAFYMLGYHVLGSGNVMLDEYAEEIRIANEKREELIRTGALINENTVTLLTDEGSLSAGKKIYDVNCVPCHGPDGGGIVGPNLTDDYWVHGGGVKNVFRIIREGVPAKGMISWKTMLNPKQIQEVSSYVLSLKGKAPGGKGPEGQFWTDTIKTNLKTDSLKTDTLKPK